MIDLGKRRIATGFLVAFVLIYLLVSFAGQERVFTEISNVDAATFALGFCVILVSIGLRALVWVRFLVITRVALQRTRIVTLYAAAEFVRYVTPYGMVTAEPFIAYAVSREGALEYERGLAGVASADFLNYIP